MSEKKVLLSGVKPTGRPHIGNYFGAMRQFVDLQDKYGSLIFVADYHAITTLHDPEVLRKNVRGVMLDYLAIGLDPKKTTLYRQSDISEHTELAWIFNSITTMPFLMRAHAFKDAEAKNKELSVGTFDYPMLMAADILLYEPDVVPVGQDQKQHIEIARDTAEKFNRLFGATFKLPKALIREEVATVPGTDGQKMSKSYNNTIPLFASRDEITKAVMGIVTDSSGELPANVYAIHKLLVPESELAGVYESFKGKYKDIKERLVEDLDSLIKPIREKRKELDATDGLVEEVLEKGGAVAKKLASAKMETVRKAIGVR